MNRSSLVSLSLFVFAFSAAGVSLPISGQTKNDSLIVLNCERASSEKEIRRVLPAHLSKDGAGEFVYTISGNESWRRTKIEVKRGEMIEINAEGVVRWAPDGTEKIDVGPEGTRPPYRDGWNYNHFPFPEAGIGSLVMRVGKGIYPVGSSRVVEVEDDGYVEFMVNDDVLHDNSGHFLVRVGRPS